MNPKWRRFAPVGLYLSLLAALVAVGLYIVQREWNLWLQISLGVVILGLALFALLDPQTTREALTGRQARYGSNALVLTLAFLGLLIVINFLVYKNAKRWDLTEDRQYTLAKETLDTLASLNEPVLAEAFFTPSMNTKTAQGLLDQYKYHGKGKFDYKFIDPNSDPIAAEQAKITRDGSISIKMGERRELANYASEQELTGALVRLMNPEKNTIYFLIGHGEVSLESGGERSAAILKRTLEGKNYTIQTVSLLGATEIPEDAKAIVVMGPRKPISEDEVKLLSAYLDKGGAIVVMEEPTPVTDFGDSPDPLRDYLANTWKITLGNDLVLDTSSNQSTIAVGTTWGSHAITSKLSTSAAILFTARSVSVGEAETGIGLTTLVSTSQKAWAETDLEAIVSQKDIVLPNEGIDILGPVPLAVVGENYSTRGRVVVFGDADFATDNFFTAYGNSDLIVNSIDWAVGKEELISLTPKSTTQRIMLPPQKVAMNLIGLGTVVILPGLALLGGIIVFIQRRRRG